MSQTEGQSPSDQGDDELRDVLAIVDSALEQMQLDARVEGHVDGRFLRLNVIGKDAESLVTGAGAAANSQVLDALQLIAMRRQAGGDSGRTVIIDAGGFREKRLAELESAAPPLGRLAAERGTAVRIWGMNSFDRRAVHLALKERRDVRTDSEGDGVFRVLCITGNASGEGGGDGDDD